MTNDYSPDDAIIGRGQDLIDDDGGFPTPWADAPSNENPGEDDGPRTFSLDAVADLIRAAGAHDAPLDVVRLRDGWTVDQIDDSGPRFHGTQVSIARRACGVVASVFTPRQIDRPGGRNFHDFPAEPLAPRSIDRFHNPSGALRALRAHRSRRHAAA